MDNLSPRYAGIVLAGGKSSRMGQNKALIQYKGNPMVTHMMNILRQSGLKDIFISGEVEGFESIPDGTPYAGPVQAICHVMKQKEGYEGYLCVPVDMPLLGPEALCMLMSQPSGGFFAAHPLPFFLRKRLNKGIFYSIREFLDANQVPSVLLPDTMREMMVNANTLDEWGKILAHK